jgi:hypothetical protein
MGEARKDALQVDFDRLVKLESHGSTISSDGGLLAYRELDEAFALTAMADEVLTDFRTGSNIQHSLTAMLCQSIHSGLAGYDDTNDAERLSIGPVMRQVVQNPANKLLCCLGRSLIYFCGAGIFPGSRLYGKSRPVE